MFEFLTMIADAVERELRRIAVTAVCRAVKAGELPSGPTVVFSARAEQIKQAARDRRLGVLSAHAENTGITGSFIA